MALVTAGKGFQRNIKAMMVLRSLHPTTTTTSSMAISLQNKINMDNSTGSSVRTYSGWTTSRSSSCRFQTGPGTTTTAINSTANFLRFRRLYYSTTTISFKDYPPHMLFPMPALSPTMELGTITSWQKNEGDSFIAGDVLCSIETDKASVDFEAQDDGVLAKILRSGPTATDIRIGTPICVVVDYINDVAAFHDFVLEEGASAGGAPATSTSTTAAAAPVPPPPAAAAMSTGDPSLVMPSARHLSHSKGVDASALEGSGKGGRVTKGDFLLALEKGTYMPPLSHAKSPAVPQAATAISAASSPSTAAAAASPTPTAPLPSVAPLSLASLPPLEISTLGTYHDVANSNMRKVIARRLTESKSQVPHYYTSMEVELDQVLALRKQLAKHHDIKVSVNDLVIRCSAMALRDVPQVNATYDPKSGTIHVQPTIDISVAVATPSGLITPIVPNTDRMGLEAISSKVKELAGRAREGKLLPQEYQGGTFCVTNLGMFGMDEFSAVINPPQAAILAVGGGSRQVVVPTPYVDGVVTQAKPTIKIIMTARLSADRRVVDEPTAALFLSAFRRYINQPELLLL